MPVCPIKRRPRVAEKDLEQAVRDYLEFDGWRCFHFEQVWAEERKRTFGELGMPDLLCIRYEIPFHVPKVGPLSEVMWIEMKTEGGRAAGHQKLWHIHERKLGALTVIAGEDFPPTFDGFLKWYDAAGFRRKM